MVQAKIGTSTPSSSPTLKDRRQGLQTNKKNSHHAKLKNEEVSIFRHIHDNFNNKTAISNIENSLSFLWEKGGEKLRKNSEINAG